MLREQSDNTCVHGVEMDIVKDRKMQTVRINGIACELGEKLECRFHHNSKLQQFECGAYEKKQESGE